MVSQRICTHILFFATHKATAEKIKRECKLPHGDTANLNRQTFARKEERTDNSTYKKLAVQWLNQALCFVSSFVMANILVLRNRQLLVAANRYGQGGESVFD